MKLPNALPALALTLVSQIHAQMIWPDGTANYTLITLPIVADSFDDMNALASYPAIQEGSGGVESTYEFACYSTATSECFGFMGWTTMTLITSPKTMQIIFNDGSVTDQTISATTGCTLTGTPFATTGTCSETYTARNGTSTFASSTTYTVPSTWTTDYGPIKATWSTNIYTATIAVVEFGTTSSGTASTSSASKPTVTKASTRTLSAGIGMGTSSGTKGSSTSSSATTATRNAAMVTGVSEWMMILGAVAGAVIGV